MFAGMIAEWFPMAVHLLEGAFFGTRNLLEMTGQRERLLALGSLSGTDLRAVLHHQTGGQGTGLGLDITWRIVVNKHHGDIGVESVPGDTRFRVRLPLTPAKTEHIND